VIAASPSLSGSQATDLDEVDHPVLIVLYNLCPSARVRFVGLSTKTGSTRA
jgi:hypothetical protein